MSTVAEDFASYQRLAQGVLQSAWSELVSGRVVRVHGRRGSVARGKIGRPTREVRDDVYGGDWRSYLEAVYALASPASIWRKLLGLEIEPMQLRVAKVLAAKFGVENARALVDAALHGDGGKPAPRWWIENRKKPVEG